MHYGVGISISHFTFYFVEVRKKDNNRTETEFNKLLNFRMSPWEWENPHPCNKDSVERENIFIWKNCTWLVIGSLMGQGCDILPK